MAVTGEAVRKTSSHYSPWFESDPLFLILISFILHALQGDDEIIVLSTNPSMFLSIYGGEYHLQCNISLSFCCMGLLDVIDILHANSGTGSNNLVSVMSCHE